LYIKKKEEKKQKKPKKIRPSDKQMASLRYKSPLKRSKVIKLRPGESKPNKIQIFQKKKVKEKPKVEPKPEEPVSKIRVIDLVKTHLTKNIKSVLKRPASLIDLAPIKPPLNKSVGHKAQTPLHKYSELFKFDSNNSKFKDSKTRTSHSALAEQRSKYRAINNFISSDDDRVGLFSKKGDYISLQDHKSESDSDQESKRFT
jgi:hypothetical protein